MRVKYPRCALGRRGGDDEREGKGEKTEALSLCSLKYQRRCQCERVSMPRSLHPAVFPVAVIYLMSSTSL